MKLISQLKLVINFESKLASTCHSEIPLTLIIAKTVSVFESHINCSFRKMPNFGCQKIEIPITQSREVSPFSNKYQL